LDAEKSKKIFVIFLVVFIDLLGFGILIPILPIFSQTTLHMSESQIGLVAGIFSLMQFIFSPLWGRLSDIYGRKPIIIFSLIGNVFSYILLGLVLHGVFATVFLLFLSRSLAGFFSANIGAAMAYISDITTPQERSKGMGIIGTAFSLGFVFGPFIGGVLAKRYDYGTPIFLSAALSLISLILAIIILKESLPDDLRRQAKLVSIKLRDGWDRFVKAIKHPNVGFLIILYFISTFSIANIYATFQLYAESKAGFELDIEQISYLFAYLGIIGALTQGVLLRPLVKWFDERKVYIAGNFIMAIGLGTIPLSHHSIPLLMVSCLLMGFGNGLNIPIGLSLISKFTERHEQGGILGLNQSLASLARFMGPSWGGFVYQFLGFFAPFFTGGIVMLIATGMSFKLLHDRFRHKSSSN